MTFILDNSIAMRKGVQVATVDKDLAEAARRAGGLDALMH